MRNFFITTDYTADFPEELVEDNFSIINMAYNIDGVEYDGNSTPYLEEQAFFTALREGRIPKTSLIPTPLLLDFFTPILEKGFDLLHICFSSGMSGTFNNCLEAQKELEQKFPNQKIIMIDSLSGCLGEGMLTHFALEERKAGKSIEEVAEFLEENKLHMMHYFTIDDMHHLKKSGRLSSFEAFIGQAIKLKPLLSLDTKGRMSVIGKSIGKKPTIKSMIERLRTNTNGIDVDEVWIGHIDALEEAQTMQQKIKNAFENVKTKIYKIGPIIASHVGCGAIALFFVGNKR